MKKNQMIWKLLYMNQMYLMIYSHIHHMIYYIIKFQNVYRSSFAVNHGSRTWIVLIVQMLLKNEKWTIKFLNNEIID